MIEVGDLGGPGSVSSDLEVGDLVGPFGDLVGPFGDLVGPFGDLCGPGWCPPTSRLGTSSVPLGTSVGQVGVL